MSEKSNRQPITREEYLFFLSIGYIYEGPVEGGQALRHYDTVSAPIDDYGRKYMMNAVNPVFVSDNTRVEKRGASHTTEAYSYQKNYEQRKQQIKDDLKRLMAQYYADEIAKEKAKKEQIHGDLPRLKMQLIGYLRKFRRNNYRQLNSPTNW